MKKISKERLAQITKFTRLGHNVIECAVEYVARESERTSEYFDNLKQAVDEYIRFGTEMSLNEYREASRIKR
jgi:hypothetical protein